MEPLEVRRAHAVKRLMGKVPVRLRSGDNMAPYTLHNTAPADVKAGLDHKKTLQVSEPRNRDSLLVFDVDSLAASGTGMSALDAPCARERLYAGMLLLSAVLQTHVGVAPNLVLSSGHGGVHAWILGPLPYSVFALCVLQVKHNMPPKA